MREDPTPLLLSSLSVVVRMSVSMCLPRLNLPFCAAVSLDPSRCLVCCCLHSSALPWVWLPRINLCLWCYGASCFAALSFSSPAEMPVLNSTATALQAGCHPWHRNSTEASCCSRSFRSSTQPFAVLPPAGDAIRPYAAQRVAGNRWGGKGLFPVAVTVLSRTLPFARLPVCSVRHAWRARFACVMCCTLGICK